MQDSPIIVPFAPWHLLEIKPRQEQQNTIDVIADYVGLVPYGQALINQAVDNCAWTCFYDGEPIVSSGVVFQFIGVGEAWSIFGEKFLERPARYKYLVYKRIAQEIDNLQSVQRVQSMCQSSFTIARKWLAHLGMEHEGTLKGYYTSTGEDAELFGKVLWPSEH